MVRLWSVVIPALVIGITLDIFGKSIHPQTYAHIFSNENLELKAILSGLFLHESWFFSVRPGSNGPFWSLSDEFFITLFLDRLHYFLPKIQVDCWNNLLFNCWAKSAFTFPLLASGMCIILGMQKNSSRIFGFLTPVCTKFFFPFEHHVFQMD